MDKDWTPNIVINEFCEIKKCQCNRVVRASKVTCVVLLNLPVILIEFEVSKNHASVRWLSVGSDYLCEYKMKLSMVFFMRTYVFCL